MKKIVIFLVVSGIFVLLTTHSSQAATYLDPADPTKPYKAGDCIMVSTRPEATTGKVYTLNPDHTKLLNAAYHNYWDRNARCDELQFHVDHGTTLARLRAWLGEVATGWYKNIGTTHFKNQTISTSRHEWFYVDEDGAHRIPDWLTAMSWGLLIEDRLSIWPVNTNNFYNNVTIAEPLNFSDGQYADEIYSYWKGGVNDYSGIPNTMVEEINYLSECNPAGCTSVFGICQYWPKFPGDPYNDLFDWSWMLHNPGCPLAD